MEEFFTSGKIIICFLFCWKRKQIQIHEHQSYFRIYVKRILRDFLQKLLVTGVNFSLLFLGNKLINKQLSTLKNMLVMYIDFFIITFIFILVVKLNIQT